MICIKTNILLFYNDVHDVEFNLFYNMIIITVRLECVANLDLSLPSSVRLVKVLKIVCRFTATVGELRRPKLTED